MSTGPCPAAPSFVRALLIPPICPARPLSFGISVYTLPLPGELPPSLLVGPRELGLNIASFRKKPQAGRHYIPSPHHSYNVSLPVRPSTGSRSPRRGVACPVLNKLRVFTGCLDEPEESASDLKTPVKGRGSHRLQAPEVTAVTRARTTSGQQTPWGGVRTRKPPSRLPAVFCFRVHVT